MKNSILFTIILAAASLTAAAQSPTLLANSQGDMLDLCYTITPAKPASAYALVITPMICGQKDTVRLEPTVIRGARNARKYHRDMRLNHKGLAETTYRKASQADPIVGQIAFNLSNSHMGWMKKEPVTLCVVTEQEGCCKAETLKVECTDPNCLPYYEEGEHPEQIEYNGESVTQDELRGDKELISCEIWKPESDCMTWYDYSDKGFFIIVTSMKYNTERLQAGGTMSFQGSFWNLQTDKEEHCVITVTLPPLEMQEGYFYGKE